MVLFLKSDNSNQLIKVPNNTYAESVKEVDNQFRTPVKGNPELLIGTFNKMLGYLSGIFELLYDEFKKCLLTTEILIVSGYGFGDKGVNTKIINWLNSENSKKLIIIHPNKKALIENSRGNLYFNVLNEHKQHQKVILIESKFEKLDWAELKKHCIST